MGHLDLFKRFILLLLKTLSNYVDLVYTETDGIFVSEDYRLPLACSFPQSYQGPV